MAPAWYNPKMAPSPNSFDYWNDYLRELPKVTAEECDLWTKGKKIEAIKQYRFRTGRGLKESKDAVENYRITGMNGLDVILAMIEDA